MGSVDDPTITIKNVTLADTGDYVCVLSNAAGDEQSDTINLQVHGEWY